MPPKKKRAYNTVPPQKGVARQYLEANFSLPDGHNTVCQKGHVLLLFLANEKSLIKTANNIREKFGIMLDGIRIRNLVMKTKSMLSNISDATTRQKLENICNQHFISVSPAKASISTQAESLIYVLDEPIHSQSKKSQTIPSALESEPLSHSHILSQSLHIDPVSSISTSLSPPLDPLPSTSTCSPFSSIHRTRTDDATHREKMMKRRLSFLSQSNAKLKKIHRDRLAKQKQKQRREQQKVFKYLHQKIRRKETTIRILKQKVSDLSRGISQGAESGLNRLKKKNKMRHQINRENTKNAARIYADFEERLKEKDKEISRLLDLFALEGKLSMSGK